MLGDLSVEGQQVGFLDGEDLRGGFVSLSIGASRGRQVRLKLVLADLHAVHLEGDLDGGVGGNRESQEAFALVLDNEGELNPLAPRQGLDFTTLAVGDALLDGGEVGEVDARTEDSAGGLFEFHTLAGGTGLGVALEGHRGELTLAGQEGGEGVGLAGADVRHIVFLGLGWSERVCFDV